MSAGAVVLFVLQRWETVSDKRGTRTCHGSTPHCSTHRWANVSPIRVGPLYHPPALGLEDAAPTAAPRDRDLGGDLPCPASAPPFGLLASATLLALNLALGSDASSGSSCSSGCGPEATLLAMRLYMCSRFADCSDCCTCSPAPSGKPCTKYEGLHTTLPGCHGTLDLNAAATRREFASGSNTSAPSSCLRRAAHSLMCFSTAQSMRCVPSRVSGWSSTSTHSYCTDTTYVR